MKPEPGCVLPFPEKTDGLAVPEAVFREDKAAEGLGAVRVEPVVFAETAGLFAEKTPARAVEFKEEVAELPG